MKRLLLHFSERSAKKVGAFPPRFRRPVMGPSPNLRRRAGESDEAEAGAGHEPAKEARGRAGSRPRRVQLIPELERAGIDLNQLRSVPVMIQNEWLRELRVPLRTRLSIFASDADSQALNGEKVVDLRWYHVVPVVNLLWDLLYGGTPSTEDVKGIMEALALISGLTLSVMATFPSAFEVGEINDFVAQFEEGGAYADCRGTDGRNFGNARIDLFVKHTTLTLAFNGGAFFSVRARVRPSQVCRAQVVPAGGAHVPLHDQPLHHRQVANGVVGLRAVRSPSENALRCRPAMAGG